MWRIDTQDLRYVFVISDLCYDIHMHTHNLILSYTPKRIGYKHDVYVAQVILLAWYRCIYCIYDNSLWLSNHQIVEKAKNSQNQAKDIKDMLGADVSQLSVCVKLLLFL